MELLFRDVRFGIRQLVRSPFFTLVSAVALALGIGSVTTQVSVLNAIMLKGLPFDEAHEIVHIERKNVVRDDFNAEVPVLEFVEWRKFQTSFEGLSAFYEGTANFSYNDQVIRYEGCFISANAFEVLGEEALIGRALMPSDEEPGAPHVVVLSHSAWVRDFGSDQDIVGQTATLNARSVTIVGVMPDSFGFPLRQDIWAPLFKHQDPALLSWGEPVVSLEVFGRLKEDVSIDAATAAMNAIALQIETEHPDTHEGYRFISVKPYVEEYLGGQTIPLSLMMFLITVLILVIACANVANLLLGRSIRRQKEFAIRSALGASRSRIVSQFLTESILLAFLGSCLAAFVVWGDLNNIQGATEELNAPYWLDFTPDVGVFLAAVFVTVMSGVASGIMPALRASRMQEGEILKDDNRTTSSLQAGKISRVLAILQISVAAIVLTLVILFVQSVQNALNLEYEFNPDEAMTARMGLFEESYPEASDRANFINQLLTRLRANPDIDFAATTNRYLFLGGFSTEYINPSTDGDNSDPIYARHQQVSEEFFDTVQLPILSGRSFQAEDFALERPRTAIVNEAFAALHWEGQAPVGKRFQARVGDIPEEEPLPWLEVVGVVPGMLEEGVFTDDPNPNLSKAAFFTPQAQEATPRFITILARGNANPQNLIRVLREEVRALDNNLPLYEVGTPRELNDQELAQFNFFATVFRDFGFLAVFLAAIGIYGVITLSVNQRIMEFGIRQALGATQTTILKLILGHTAVQIIVGLLIALLALSPVILSPGLQKTLILFFYEIESDSILPYAMSFGFVAVVALLSAAPPAIKASRIHPAQALRHE